MAKDAYNHAEFAAWYDRMAALIERGNMTTEQLYTTCNVLLRMVKEYENGLNEINEAINARTKPDLSWIN